MIYVCTFSMRKWNVLNTKNSIEQHTRKSILIEKQCLSDQILIGKTSNVEATKHHNEENYQVNKTCNEVFSWKTILKV